MAADPNFQYGRWLSNPPPGEEVVVSGMSGRLPESSTVHEFRDHLLSKTEMVTGDGRRWKLDHPEIPQRTAKIPGIDKYDAGYFGVHHRQADIMDPMIRSFMETAVESIMDAGINPVELEGSKTGVFVSISWSDMENDTFVNVTEPQKFAVTGYLRSFIAHRVCYHLKLKGPAFIIDTACSSSMNAFDAAFKAIRTGKCDSALVGCSNLLLHPGNSLQFFRLGVLSSDGICKVFDQNADGYVRGETVACLFLQKAKNSRRIYAQIINTKVNGDGFKEQGITFPSTEAQKVLMTEIYRESGVHPDDLSFFEAHGTGTQVGDPQEVEAIDSALGKRRRKPLLVGSVKSSIGHTEPASGICSIIKVLLAMETGLISPNINLKEIKNGMDGFEKGRMKVVTELTELEEEDAIIGINNFGFGGNNAHTILRRFKKTKINNAEPKDDIPRLVCVSGRTEESVLKLLNDAGAKRDVEFVGLLHQMYRADVKNHRFRGFTIVSKNGSPKTSSKFFASQQPLYFYFGQFRNNYKSLSSYLLNFESYRNSISRIDKVLLDKNVAKDDQIEDIIGGISTQIGIVDIMKLLEIEPVAVYGDSWGKLISAYYYDVISAEETVLTTIKILRSDSDKKPEINSFIKNNVEKVQHDSLGYDNLIKTDKNSFILNISDSHLNTKDVLLSEGFLDVLGRLYEQGHNPQLHRLYPVVEYPVSRGTRMISPSIQWDHSKSWYTYKFSQFTASDAQQNEYNFSFLYDECKFIAGHVIDGRNLFPATEYLKLVWETFAQCRRLLVSDLPVAFEHVKFIRAVTMPKNGFVKLLVTIQQGSGAFEVLEKNTLVVSGRIYASSEETNLVPLDFEDGALEQDEIYKELYLRGYNYSGVFKGIQRCSVDGSTGLIKWENNWSSFMDKMLQMKILQADTRMLYVPVGIKKLMVNPLKQMEIVEKLEGEEPLVPVYVYKECDIIKSAGIEICGLEAKSIAKRKPLLEPVLEKYTFVPNSSLLGLSELIRVNTQIILENSLEHQFKAVEIIDDYTNPNREFLLPLVCKALDDVPVVTPDLTISTKNHVEETIGVKVDDFVLTPESNLLLIVGTKILQRPTLPKLIVEALHPKGYILTREETSYVPHNPENMIIVTEYVTPNEKIILLKKSERFLGSKFIEISSSTFEWLPILQNSLKYEPNIVLYSKNQELTGTLGLVNCLRREPNGNKIKCFFMIDSAPDFDPQNPFYLTQIEKDQSINVYKNGSWGTYRHLLLEEPLPIDCESCYANVTTRGDISSLKWIEGPFNENSPLKPDEILVLPYYSSINFKDIMVASGRINVDVITKDRIEQECVIGFEFAGTDLSGRRIVGMIDNRAFATHVAADRNFIWEIPDAWTLEDAATVPVVYCTVIYALQMVGQWRPGASILIHSATGGIGLAALNICLYNNCEIFVTVGTQEKREYLRKHYPQIPDCHVGNSRDTSFEEMIKIRTKGRGVDIVLNSLSEEKLKASVRCLARGGRLLEIGKFDMANDTSLDLLLMERGVSYHGVMLDQVFKNSPGLKRELKRSIQEGINVGFIRPLPRIVFDREEIEAAHRFMMTGKHMGKVLLKIRNEDGPVGRVYKVIPRFNCDSKKCYVILGGLGGVGLELADWLMLRGAKKLVLVSRTGIQTGYQTQRIRIWESYGVDVRVSTKDVTTRRGCTDLIKEANELGPIDGIFNLAVVLKDALIEDQSEEDFVASMAPKAQATIHLDQVTRESCPDLRYFVVFSSVSCGRGNAGQANYGMSNSIMERLCEKRKCEGLPALAIQWGAIGEVGLVAKMQKENKELVIGGTLQQKISSCLQVLDRFLKQDNPIVASMVVAEKHDRSYGIMGAVELVALTLGIKDMKTVSQHATLAELGMDSMMGTEIIQVLEKNHEIYITAKDVRSLTFAKLAEIETEKRINAQESKSQQGYNHLIQYIPDSKTTQVPILKLHSRVAEDEEAPTVFILPGIEGVFTPLEPLVKNLKSHVLGVQYKYHDPEDSIEEVARNVLPHMEEHLTKDSTFIIIGYSFGADVGLEVVKLLEDRGYKGEIIIIDGSPTYLSNSAKEYLPGETDDQFESDLIYKVTSVMIPLENLGYKDKLLKCPSLDARIDLALSLASLDVTSKEKLEKQAAITLYKRFKATINYKFVHKKIKSTIHLFKAKYSMVKEEEDYQLSKLCEKQVLVTTIDGDHASILNHPELAKGVNQLIM